VVYPRPLTDAESNVLAYLLTADVPGVEALREQAKSVVVTERCRCGCASIDLYVDPTTASPAVTTEPIPVEASTRPEYGSEIFSLLLFVRDGWLALLEIVYYGDFIPVDFPPTTAFESPTVH
jgi:hypothetical protein